MRSETTSPRFGFFTSDLRSTDVDDSMSSRTCRISDTIAHTMGAILVVACLATARPASAESGGSNSETTATSPEARSGPAWSGVERLAEEYRGRWYLDAFELIPGSVLVWAGVRRMLVHQDRGFGRAGSWDFPWFGLYFTLTGTGTIATSLYLTLSHSPTEAYPRRLLESDVSERAAELYLRHRAEIARRERIASAANTFASTIFGGTYVLLLPTRTDSQQLENRITGIGTIAIGVGLGIYKLLTRSLEEKIWKRVRSASEQRAAVHRATSDSSPSIRAAPLLRVDPRTESTTGGAVLELSW